MRKFRLKYPNTHMEKEYSSLQRQNNTENLQLTFYFLIFLIVIPGIPAIISKNYMDLGITLGALVILVIIYFWKVIPRKYVQFAASLVICSFDYCLFLMPTSSFYSSSKGLMFFRGYAFASINIALLSRFSNLKQKILFLLYSYVFRFVLIICLDPDSVEVYTIIRHVYIDAFVAYINFSQEKKNRNVFKSFYDYREELTKFKELLVNYLPQSITVFRSFIDQPLFSNQAFQHIFDQPQEDIRLNIEGYSPKSQPITQLNLIMGGTKPHLKLLEVNKDTIREIRALSPCLKSSDHPIYLQDVVNYIVNANILEKKPLALYASYSNETGIRSFEVILTKVKWDGEDAIAIILNKKTCQQNPMSVKLSEASTNKIIATVSHELRTPLNGIIGILEMIERRVNNQKVIEDLGLCKDNAQLLLSLVNSILDINQIREGKLRLNPGRMELKKVLEDVMRLFAFQCSYKGIYLTLKTSPEDEDLLNCVNTDENRLKQILINLIGNALKFTSKGGITLEARQDPADTDLLQISVADTGIGIKDEDKKKLFQMYEKFEYGRSVNKNGVGLGLTISNTLAGLLSGRKGERAIQVVSKEGQGSKFSFKILKNLEKQLVGDKESRETLQHSNESENSLARAKDPESFHIPKEHPKMFSDTVEHPSRVKEYTFLEQSKVQVPQVFEMETLYNPSKLLPTSFSYVPIGDQTFKNQFSTNLQEKNTYSTSYLQPTKGCILVVDDNPFNLLIVEHIVNEAGYLFKAAKNGYEAIEILKLKAKESNFFQAILMDCQMPGLDGYETTKIIQEMIKNEEISKVPVIALTSNIDEEDIRKCYESGMISYLSKPLSTNSLLKTLVKYEAN